MTPGNHERFHPRTLALSSGICRSLWQILQGLPGTQGCHKLRQIFVHGKQLVKRFHIAEVPRGEPPRIRKHITKIMAERVIEMRPIGVLKPSFLDVASDAPIEGEHVGVDRHGGFYLAALIALPQLTNPARVILVSLHEAAHGYSPSRSATMASMARRSPCSRATMHSISALSAEMSTSSRSSGFST